MNLSPVQTTKQNYLSSLFPKILNIFKSQQQKYSEQILVELNSQNPNKIVVEQLAEKLIQNGSRFEESRLGYGPWTVKFTKGAALPWLVTYQAAQIVNKNNKAQQNFDTKKRSAINSVQFFGNKVIISANGTYIPTEKKSSTPIECEVTVFDSQIQLWGVKFPLPITGKGKFKVLYVDEAVRIFDGGKLISVQVRDDLLV